MCEKPEKSGERGSEMEERVLHLLGVNDPHDTRPVGYQMILELYDVDPNLLKDPDYIQKTLERAAIEAGAQVLSSYYHPFPGEGGVTGFTCVSASHISMHAWPEYCYGAVDIFFCGDEGDLNIAKRVVLEGFKPKACDCGVITRSVRLRYLPKGVTFNLIYKTPKE